MPGWKHLLVTIVLILAILMGGTSCVLVNTGNNSNATGSPICLDWTPLYIDDAVGAPLDNESLVNSLAPTVVSIITEKVTRDRFFRPVPETGAGSGVIIDPQGFVVTNSHVVEGARSLKVILSDGLSFDAVKWVNDSATDLAVILIEPKDPLPYARFLSDSLDKLSRLEEVVAVGNALALPGGPTWTKGVVSYLGRAIQLEGGHILEDLIQTDAAINPGNSGGPLVNMAGQVVGINVAIVAGAENIGFAISTDTAVAVINALVTKGFVSCAWLGVRMITVTPAIKSEYGLSVDYGALIVEVISGSPAAKAGLRADDVIIKFGNQEIRDTEQLRSDIQSRDPGATVSITYVRDTQTLTTTATLVQRPSS
jgi:serine protease Do